MANHKSAIKRHKQSEKRNERNRASKAKSRTLTKAALGTGSVKDVAAAESAIAKSAAKGIIHKKSAARKIGRLKAKVAKKA